MRVPHRGGLSTTTRRLPAGTVLAIAAVMSPGRTMGSWCLGQDVCEMACFPVGRPRHSAGLSAFVDAPSRRCAESAPAPILRDSIQ